MDFVDPKKTFKQKLLLIIGYFLTAIAVVEATIILVYAAYGYGISSNGQVIQNGLLYIASQPNPANIYLNGKLNSSQTNSRLTLPAGIYNIRLTRTGYRSWTRSIEVDGGVVEHLQYPLLIPKTLITKSVRSLSLRPDIATQSPNRQWIVIQKGATTAFELYNLNNLNSQSMPTPTQISLPAGVASVATSGESWQVIGWANDNQHVLLEHDFNGQTEYIMLNIANPSQSFNLSQSLAGYSFTSIQLDNQRYNQYFLYDSTTGTLKVVSLSNPGTPVRTYKNILAYDGYDGNTLLYATPVGAAKGMVNIDENISGQVYKIKSFPAGANYLLNMAGYNGVVYVAIGSNNLNKVFIYQNPVGQLQSSPQQDPVPSQVLFVRNPNYLSFSQNAQYIMTENGQKFAVYDIFNNHGYNYTTNLPLQAPQQHATWMDGNRLTYISGSKLVMFEFDHNYRQTLESNDPNYVPFFSGSYHYVYSLSDKGSGLDLTQTALLTPQDL